MKSLNHHVIFRWGKITITTTKEIKTAKPSSLFLLFLYYLPPTPAENGRSRFLEPVEPDLVVW